MVRNWSEFLGQEEGLDYVMELPFRIQPVREIYAVRDHPGSIFHRSTYYGPFEEAIVSYSDGKDAALQEREFYYPPQAYWAPIPLTKSKYTDLQVLKQYCGPEARLYYENLPYIQSEGKQGETTTRYKRKKTFRNQKKTK